MTESIKVKIYSKMKEKPPGEIFTISDFYPIGNKEAIKKSLMRLVDKGEIVR